MATPHSPALHPSAALDRWAALLRDLLAKVPEVCAYANNHYAGHGPTTIRDPPNGTTTCAPPSPSSTACSSPVARR